MQMLPREVILALVLIDLPINLDRKDDATLRKGFGASWWYVACECDDYYVDIVEEVVTLCSFAQVRALCLLKDEASDVLLGRATPKSKSTLARALRFLGRYEFVDSDPIYTDACCGVKAFNALDFGTQEDPAPDNKRVVLKCFSREDSFVHEVSKISCLGLSAFSRNSPFLLLCCFQTAVLRELDIDVDYFEEIVAFAVGGVDADKSPLANDGRQRFFVSIERPYLTLSGVVRGMLGNHDCQNDVIVRQRYSAKVFSVLRVVAKALQSLHGQGFIHGDLCLENCGKYDDKWKLSDLLGAQKIGETFDPARLSSSAPPEAIEPLRTSGTKRQVAFRTDLVSRPSFDSWAFGKLAYEVLVGDALVAFDESKSIEEDYESLTNLVHWNDFNVEDARQHLERVGISNAGISLVTSCLSPDEETRLSMDGVLTHAVWSELRRQSQSNK